MPIGYSMRLLSVTLGIASVATVPSAWEVGPVHGERAMRVSRLPARGSPWSSEVAARVPACPLVVQALRRQGTAVQVLLRNPAPYAVGNIVIHVAFMDAARAMHQLAFHMNSTVAQHLTTVYTTPPITGAVVVWSTVAVTTECHMVRH